jgi:tryptophan 2,3-dioxygenase
VADAEAAKASRASAPDVLAAALDRLGGTMAAALVSTTAVTVSFGEMCKEIRQTWPAANLTESLVPAGEQMFQMTDNSAQQAERIRALFLCMNPHVLYKEKNTLVLCREKNTLSPAQL